MSQNNKPRLLLLNAIPANAILTPAALLVYPIDWERARELVRNYEERDVLESYIGHASTAAVLSKELGVEVSVNRGEARLSIGDRAIVVVLNRRVSGDVAVSKDDLRLLSVYVVDVMECTQPIL